MKNSQKKFVALFFNIIFLFLAFEAKAQTSPFVTVTGYGIHFGGQLVYRYQIINNSPGLIESIQIGDDSVGGGFIAKPWDVDTGNSEVPVTMPLSRCKPFDYMRCQAVVYQFDFMHKPATILTFSSAEYDIVPMPSNLSTNSLISGFGVSSVAEIYVHASHPSYLNAKAIVKFSGNFPKDPSGKVITKVTVPITKIDNNPPELKGTYTVKNINGFLNLKFNLSATDDRDPSPVIKLSSVTSLQDLAPGDVSYSGSGDRTISLRAVKGRYYKINFLTIDGSENSVSNSFSIKSP